MSQPSDGPPHRESPGEEAPAPWPGPLGAIFLLLFAWLMVPVVASLALSFASQTAALGIGLTLGVGGAAAMGAVRVPPPQAERLGLRGFARRQGLALLLLVPTVLLASEVDNRVRALAPPPDAEELARRTRERVPTDTPLALTETMLVSAGLAPIAEEWLFRGVIQQGLVGRYGAPGGVLATSLLFAVGHGSPGISAAAWLAVATSTFLTGLVLGFVRLATGSLLAPMLLHAAMNAVGALALAFAEQAPVPGFNAPGATTPATWLLPAAASVAFGLGALRSSLGASGRGE